MFVAYFTGNKATSLLGAQVSLKVKFSATNLEGKGNEKQKIKTCKLTDKQKKMTEHHRKNKETKNKDMQINRKEKNGSAR